MRASTYLHGPAPSAVLCTVGPLHIQSCVVKLPSLPCRLQQHTPASNNKRPAHQNIWKPVCRRVDPETMLLLQAVPGEFRSYSPLAGASTWLLPACTRAGRGHLNGMQLATCTPAEADAGARGCWESAGQLVWVSSTCATPHCQLHDAAAGWDCRGVLHGRYET